LRLLPVGAWRFSPFRLTTLALHYLRQSVVAGVQVAWLALNPRLPLRLGFVTYAVQLAPGAARNTFCTLSSLLPGTLPAGSDERGALIILRSGSGLGVTPVASPKWAITSALVSRASSDAGRLGNERSELGSDADNRANGAEEAAPNIPPSRFLSTIQRDTRTEHVVFFNRLIP
jgi:hypothetical protein